LVDNALTGWPNALTALRYITLDHKGKHNSDFKFALKSFGARPNFAKFGIIKSEPSLAPFALLCEPDLLSRLACLDCSSSFPRYFSIIVQTVFLTGIHSQNFAPKPSDLLLHTIETKASSQHSKYTRLPQKEPKYICPPFLMLTTNKQIPCLLISL
jgi:hypothetical protein